MSGKLCFTALCERPNALGDDSIEMVRESGRHRQYSNTGESVGDKIFWEKSGIDGIEREGEGEKAAAELEGITGKEIGSGSNGEVPLACDMAILTIPKLEEADFLNGLKAPIEGENAISPMVPMQMENSLLAYSKEKVSAAEEVASFLENSRVVVALQRTPALTLAKKRKIDFDVLVACDSGEDCEEVTALIERVLGHGPLYVEPLSTARVLEPTTTLLINSGRLNKPKSLSLKLVH